MTTEGRDHIEAEEERLKDYAERTHNPPTAPTTDVGPPAKKEDKDENNDDDDK